MTNRFSSKNKEKKGQKENSVNKRRTYKETENSVAGSRTRFICTCKQLLKHCTTVKHMI